MLARLLTGLRSRHRRSSQPSRSRSARLAIEHLECREVPAAVAPLATFDGSVAAPHGPGWVDLQVETPSNRVLLAFDSAPSSGSALRAGTVRLFTEGGTLVNSPRSGDRAGFSLKVVSDGMYFARTAGARSTAGDFTMSVRLAGDVDGDGQVTSQDLDVIRSLRGVRVGEAGFISAADVNHNGKIGIADLRLARWNIGRSAAVGPISAEQFLFATSAALGRQPIRPLGPVTFNPATMSGITLVIPDLFAPSTNIVPINADAFSWDVQNVPSSGGGGGGGTGKAVMTDLRMSMKVSKADPKLFEAVTTGRHFQTATLFVGRVGTTATPQLQWDMEDVQFTEYSTAGTVKAGVPQVQDTIALTFARLRITFTPTRPNGTVGGAVSFGWDFELNKQF